MANKNISDLPASGAMVSTTLMEAQLTGAGQNQKATLAQLLTFIQNNATAFSLGVAFAQAVTAGAGSISLNADGSATFAAGAGVIDALGNLAGKSLVLNTDAFTFNSDGSAFLANGGVSIAPTAEIQGNSDIEVQSIIKGFITWSPDGTRWRIKVNNAGNLGTEAA